MTLCLFNFFVSGQVRQAVDYAPDANLRLLPAKQQIKGTEYRSSIRKNESFKMNPVPFFPYVNVNLNAKFIPFPPPFRVYLGKLSTSLKNDDYILIVVKCTWQPNDKNSKIITKSGFAYVDDDGILQRSGIGSKFYSIRVTKYPGSTDKITYTAITDDQANKYVTIFINATSNKNLAGKYSICNVIEGLNNSVKDTKKDIRIRFQPVILSGSKPPRSTNGGTKSFVDLRKFFFQNTYGLEDADNQTNVCCETPPEIGNSLPKP